MKHLVLAMAWALLAASAAAADVSRTVVNNGNLVMEDIPPIPQSIVRWSGAVTGDPQVPSSNLPVAFDRDGTGFWLVTDLALRARGQPAWDMNALNEGHGYRRQENVDAYQQAMVMFFREHLVGRVR